MDKSILLSLFPLPFFFYLTAITSALGFLCGIGFYFYTVWSSKNSRLTRILYTLFFPALFLLIVSPFLYSVRTGYRKNDDAWGLEKLSLAISRSSNNPAESAELLKILREWRRNENHYSKDLWGALHNRYPEKRAQLQLCPEEIERKLPPDETPGNLPTIQSPPIKTEQKIESK